MSLRLRWPRIYPDRNVVKLADRNAAPTERPPRLRSLQLRLRSRPGCKAAPLPPFPPPTAKPFGRNADANLTCRQQYHSAVSPAAMPLSSPPRLRCRDLLQTAKSPSPPLPWSALCGTSTPLCLAVGPVPALSIPNSSSLEAFPCPRGNPWIAVELCTRAPWRPLDSCGA